MYNHRAHKRMGARPKRSRDSNQTLSGYWEVNGTRAHCLLDSECKGIMISPDFTCAMGIVTKMLENPVALQLACIGSKSTISYGAVLQSTCSGWRWVAYMHLSGSGNCGEQKESGF